jgi:hypothetical protein
LLSLPRAGSGAFSIEAASTNGNGFATNTRSGSTSISVTADELQTISTATSVRLDMTARAGSSGIGRIRSDDKIELALSGNFDITVNVGQ